MFLVNLSRSYANHLSTTNNITAEPLEQCFSNKDYRTSLALLLLLMVMAKQETGNDVKYRDRKLNSDVWNGQRRDPTKLEKRRKPHFRIKSFFPKLKRMFLRDLKFEPIWKILSNRLFQIKILKED